MTTIKFCLVMIVRDESSIIQRSLTSMRNIIDSFYIMDTGSLDNTCDIIETFMKTNEIPGEITYEPWKNFGYNKSLLLKKAREHMNSVISCAEYYVWLDADEVWITNKNDPTSYFTKTDAERLYKELNENANIDIFNICTIYGNLEYFRWNIVRNNQLYVWKQPVHEYLEGTESNKTRELKWFYLLARKEGHSSMNPDRQQNDIRMFLEFLEENPDDPRSTFYLAQTYEEIRQTELAKSMYKKRIKNTSGYYNERYISCLRMGRLVSEPSEKKRWWLEGCSISPKRLECYYELMMLEHNCRNYNAAYSWAFMAPTNRTIESSFMFAEKDIYTYRFDMYMAICAYYAEQYKVGYDANLRAISGINNEHDHYDLLVSNSKWFLPKLQMSVSLSHNVPRQEFIVVENFYEHPDEVRKEALLAEYNVTGNFPGTRSPSYIYSGIREKFERIIGRPITWWKDDGYNGSFQWTNATMKSWIHRDKTDWSAIVFLTPNAPANGGTRFYTHKETNKSYADTEEMESLMQKDTWNEDGWVLTDTIGNIYNRCVLFRGKRSHISDQYFGETLENGRLFQMFFFND